MNTYPIFNEAADLKTYWGVEV